MVSVNIEVTGSKALILIILTMSFVGNYIGTIGSVEIAIITGAAFTLYGNKQYNDRKKAE